MGTRSTHAGKAPCRHCGQNAAKSPVQRLRAARAFSAEREQAADAPNAAAGHDFARVAVRPGPTGGEG